MLTNSPSVSTTDRPYLKSAGLEPLPGYRILEPLGRGGFGEVWLCEAPGGLHKAVKFVPGDREGSGNYSLLQEFEAFQTIKSIRHPFLLTLERVELIDNDLVMVMELADAHLQDRQCECQAIGLPGIPRPELLGYLHDAAEALDHIGLRYGLQHLDVKPANLFILSGHVKVGDYGLVARLTAGAGANPVLNRGLTPKYVAPEVLRGQIHPASDEYSLALVYFELLTGTFPFPARTAQQMMLAHVSAVPNLTFLPSADQSIVAKALAKNPDDRYPSCLAFVQALYAAEESSGQETLPPHHTRFHVPRRPVLEQATDRMMAPPDDAVLEALSAGVDSRTNPARPREAMPALRTVPRPAPQGRTQPVAPPVLLPDVRPTLSAPPAQKIPARQTLQVEPEPVQLTTVPREMGIRLPAIRSVVTVAALQGADAPPPALWADQVVDVVLAKAAAGGQPAKMPGEIGRRTDGTWVIRFPSTMAASLVKLKCDPMVENDWFDEVVQIDRNRFALRQFIQSGGLWSRFASKKPASGLEIEIVWPTTRNCGEVEVFGRLIGTPDSAFVRDSLDAIPRLMAEIQRQLQNVEDRRKSQRLPTDLPIRLYPVADDGTILEMVSGKLMDISTGGLCCAVSGQPTSRYCFANFDGCGIADGLAVLLRLLRVNCTGYEYVVAGKFRTDL
jgi:eukaryotic-like serine/threonine-protein kinase